MNLLSKPQVLRALAAALALALTAAPTWAAEGSLAKPAAAATAQTALPALPSLSDLPSPSLPQVAAVDQIL
ncbi:MAG: TolC family protein, partial [Thiomonas sp.]